MWMRTKLSLMAAGLTLGLFACAVGGGDGTGDDDPLDGLRAGDAAVGLGDSSTLLGGGTAGLDSGAGSPTGGTFGGGFGGSVVDSSVPRDSSVRPVDSSTAALGGLGGLIGGLLGGLFGGGDAGAP